VDDRRERRGFDGMLTNLPNLLTLSRIGAIPLLVTLFYVDGNAVRWVACALFTAAALTDYFDGYFARTRRQVSPVGRFLDPIADKLLVASVLFMLVAFDRISGLTLLPALVILCREITVSGLREFLAGLRVGVPVSRLAKWKTGIQMTAIGFLIVGDAGLGFIPVTLIGEVGLWVAAILTIVTGYDYLRAGLAHMTGMEPAPRMPRRRKGERSDVERKPMQAGQPAARL
jgi:cardiolipin synthase